MMIDMLDNIEKRFDLSKTNARVIVNQSFVISLTKLLIGKGLISNQEIVALISYSEDQMRERLKLAEELYPNRSAGIQTGSDKKKRRIRKEYEILRKIFE